MRGVFGASCTAQEVGRVCIGALCPESSGRAPRGKHSVDAGWEAQVEPMGPDEQVTQGVGGGEKTSGWGRGS